MIENPNENYEAIDTKVYKKPMEDELPLTPLAELDADSLSELVSREISAVGISQENKKKIFSYLKQLEQHDISTFMHSVRVGILSLHSAEASCLSKKPLLIAGLLHDVGKLDVDAEILSKKDNFSQEDYDSVKNHVLSGFNLLKDDFAYSAAILVQHHTFQKTSYPENLPEFHAFLSEQKDKISKMAQIISLLDFYDAITTRQNEKYHKEKMDSGRIREILLENYKDLEVVIYKLYEDRILV